MRVAVREIHEALYRAFIAAGASAGEAATAAAIAADSEVHSGAGITAALSELPRVPSGHVPMSRDPQHPDRLLDPAGRGPLLRMPVATDLVAAIGRPLFLTGMIWNPVIPAALHRTCSDQGIALAAVEVTDTGAVGAVSVGYPDGSTDWAVQQPVTTALLDGIAYDQALEVTVTAGVLLMPAALGATRTGRHSAVTRNQRADKAFAGGVQVDAVCWAALYAAAALFLVPAL